MVDAPCRRLTSADLWNGQAPQSTTGVANARLAHCQPGNCRGGIIASTTTGMANAAQPVNRRRSPAARSIGGLAGVGTEAS